MIEVGVDVIVTAPSKTTYKGPPWVLALQPAPSREAPRYPTQRGLTEYKIPESHREQALSALEEAGFIERHGETKQDIVFDLEKITRGFYRWEQLKKEIGPLATDKRYGDILILLQFAARQGEKVD